MSDKEDEGGGCVFGILMLILVASVIWVAYQFSSKWKKQKGRIDALEQRVQSLESRGREP